jgi:hypothetical protein
MEAAAPCREGNPPPASTVNCPVSNRGDPSCTSLDAHITPIVALIAGILILIVPRLLNYVVAIYLIVVGLMGLNAIHHFVH